MLRARPLAIWLAALGLALVAIVAVAGTNGPGSRASESKVVASTHHLADGDATVSQRHQPVRPALLWWVAAIAALLLAVQPWRRLDQHGTDLLRPATPLGRYDRGPPSGLITP